ncbi:hypothetical protein KKF84_03200, partial [Myxococcota bacterium]|nr:hypothetical protein [Myxococcota bacterium]
MCVTVSHPKDNEIKAIKASARRRGRSVAALGARAGVDAVATYLGSVFRSPLEKQERRERVISKHASAFAQELGELKGAIM